MKTLLTIVITFISPTLLAQSANWPTEQLKTCNPLPKSVRTKCREQLLEKWRADEKARIEAKRQEEIEELAKAFFGAHMLDRSEYKYDGVGRGVAVQFNYITQGEPQAKEFDIEWEDSNGLRRGTMVVGYLKDDRSHSQATFLDGKNAMGVLNIPKGTVLMYTYGLFDSEDFRKNPPVKLHIKVHPRNGQLATTIPVKVAK